MKLIYYSVAVTLFCMASFAAPTARVERQADDDCTCPGLESNLKTGLRILRDTISPPQSNWTTISTVAAICKVLITSHNTHNRFLNSQQKEMIRNQTCDMFQRLRVSTIISDCTDTELTELQCSRAIASSHMIGRDTVDNCLEGMACERAECYFNKFLRPVPTQVEQYIRDESMIGL